MLRLRSKKRRLSRQRVDVGSDQPFDLDTQLIRFNKLNDGLKARDLVNSVLVCAATGSGKSSSVLACLNIAAMRAGASLLIPTVKPDDVQRFLRQAERAGRSGDVRVFGIGDTFNPLAFEQEHNKSAGGRLESLVSLITLPLERQSRMGTGGDPHWKVASADLVRALCVIFDAGGVRISFRLIHETITSLPMSMDDVHDPAWQQSCPAYGALQHAMERDHTDAEQAQLDMAARHLLRTIPSTPHKTMMSTVQTLSSSLSPLLHGEIGAALSSEVDSWDPTTLIDVPQVTVLDIPVQTWGRAGETLQRLLITATQREIIRRRPDQIGVPMIMFSCDEAAQLIDADDDLRFMVTCRDRRAFLVLGIQSLSSLRLALDSASNARVAEAIFGAPGVKLFGASTDPDTMSAISRIFSVVPTPKYSFGTNKQEGGKDGDSKRPGGPGQSFNYHSDLANDVNGSDLLCLKNGGPENNYVCEFFCSVAGRKWNASKKSSIKVAFRQRFN